MKNLASKIRALVSTSSSPIAACMPLDFIKNKKNILKELVLSKESGNAIGVYSKAMGDGMFLTVVEQIEANGVIIFNRYDMSGAILNRYELTIDEIQMVCPVNQRYRHPLLSATGIATRIALA
ncbi:MAG TPA: hypothetical protein VGD40_25100 [Chryseosolibacter sp.]